LQDQFQKNSPNKIDGGENERTFPSFCDTKEKKAEEFSLFLLHCGTFCFII
jgi:hypothetical protein